MLKEELRGYFLTHGLMRQICYSVSNSHLQVYRTRPLCLERAALGARPICLELAGRETSGCPNARGGCCLGTCRVRDKRGLSRTRRARDKGLLSLTAFVVLHESVMMPRARPRRHARRSTRVMTWKPPSQPFTQKGSRDGEG